MNKIVNLFLMILITVLLVGCNKKQNISMEEIKPATGWQEVEESMSEDDKNAFTEGIKTLGETDNILTPIELLETKEEDGKLYKFLAKNENVELNILERCIITIKKNLYGEYSVISIEYYRD